MTVSLDGEKIERERRRREKGRTRLADCFVTILSLFSESFSAKSLRLARINSMAKCFYAIAYKTDRRGIYLEAYVLVNAESGMIWEVAKAMLKIEGVKMAHAVTGQFDAVAYVEFPKMEDLGKIIEKIQHLKSVNRTQTLIAIPPTIRG